MKQHVTYTRNKAMAGEMAQRRKLCYGSFATRVWAPRTHIKPHHPSAQEVEKGFLEAAGWLANQADSGSTGLGERPCLSK